MFPVLCKDMRGISFITYSYLSLLHELHHLPRQDVAYTRVKPDQVALLELGQHLELQLVLKL